VHTRRQVEQRRAVGSDLARPGLVIHVDHAGPRAGQSLQGACQVLGTVPGQT
jgi:hypothetical protein